MDQLYVPIVSAFVGGLTATIAALGTVWLQARAQDRRERMKFVIELAREDYRQTKESVMHSGTGALAPLVTFLHYHTELQKILDRRELTPEDVVHLRQRNKAIIEAVSELTTQRKR